VSEWAVAVTASLTMPHPSPGNRNVEAQDGSHAYVVRRVKFDGSEHNPPRSGSKECGGSYEWAAQAAYFVDCTKAHLQKDTVRLARDGEASAQPASSEQQSAQQARA
jgi:hypothetical protein